MKYLNSLFHNQPSEYILLHYIMYYQEMTENISNTLKIAKTVESENLSLVASHGDGLRQHLQLLILNFGSI